MAHAGIMHFAEAGGGLTVGLTGQILGAAMTVGAIANHFQQNRQRRNRRDTKKKEPIVAHVKILSTGQWFDLTQKQLDQMNKEQKAYNDCVAHETEVFNQDVGNVKAAADKHFEERKGNWANRAYRVVDKIDSILKFITGEGGEFDPGDSGSLPDLLNEQARIDEIEAGTKKAAERRDKGIKNCKKP